MTERQVYINRSVLWYSLWMLIGYLKHHCMLPDSSHWYHSRGLKLSEKRKSRYGTQFRVSFPEVAVTLKIMLYSCAIFSWASDLKPMYVLELTQKALMPGSWPRRRGPTQQRGKSNFGNLWQGQSLTKTTRECIDSTAQWTASSIIVLSMAICKLTIVW